MNNFDMSSRGENIEFWCHYDVDLATMFYEEFVGTEAKRLDMGRNSALFLVGDSTKPHYTKAQLSKMSKQELYGLCMDLDLLDWRTELNDYLRADYEETLMRVSIEEYYKLAIEANTWHDLPQAITHDWYISRGYSQGDAVYIVSLDRPLDNQMRKHIDRILWDCPISIRARVESKLCSQEFDEEYFLDDPYDWDLEQVKNKIQVLPVGDYAKGFLMDSLPDYPSYL